jgi:hypothetical protein
VANYELINDNLFDLTHLSYVHEKILGRNSMSWAKATPIERGLRIARWVEAEQRPLSQRAERRLLELRKSVLSPALVRSSRRTDFTRGQSEYLLGSSLALGRDCISDLSLPGTLRFRRMARARMTPCTQARQAFLEFCNK